MRSYENDSIIIEYCQPQPQVKVNSSEDESHFQIIIPSESADASAGGPQALPLKTGYFSLQGVPHPGGLEDMF